MPASSLSKVATLGALRGHEVEVRVGGNQAREALDHVLTLAARGFDEPADPGGTAQRDVMASAASSAVNATDDTGGRRIRTGGGIPGVGIGPAASLRGARLNVADARADDPALEWRRLKSRSARSGATCSGSGRAAAREIGEADAAIFDAHLLLLDDADLLGEVRSRVDGGQAAAPAWAATVERVRAELAAIPDPYLQARASDVTSVGEPCSASCLACPASTACPAGYWWPAISPRPRPPSWTARGWTRVVLAFGSTTAHATILLRGRGVPAVVGAGAAVLRIPDGTLLAVDGTRGEVVVDPAAAVQASFRARAAELDRRERLAVAGAKTTALTRDGVEVLVGGNVGSVEDARAAAASGADLAGLVRTEFLFLGRSRAPDVDEQEASLPGDRRGARQPADHAAHPGRRRGQAARLPADASRGQPVPRGARDPAVAGPPRAARRPAAGDGPAGARRASQRDVPDGQRLDEVVQARQLLDDAIKRVGRGEPPDLQVGIMVEVPATALKGGCLPPMWTS